LNSSNGSNGSTPHPSVPVEDNNLKVLVVSLETQYASMNDQVKQLATMVKDTDNKVKNIKKSMNNAIDKTIENTLTRQLSIMYNTLLAQIMLQFQQQF
jgi:predicted  nucleic acid-binding Zn-ribbon protein